MCVREKRLGEAEMTIQRIGIGPAKSEISIHAGVVYIAGQTASEGGGTVTAQTREVLARMDELLERAGTAKHRLLSVTVCLADLLEFEEMNIEWKKWVHAASPPCRATIVAAPAGPGLNVEMFAIAAL